jgi:glycosyltransferase involved in cell wall biosynthesis
VFGYTLAVAMGPGCPIVATATGGLAEIARDGVDGLLVPPADPDALARATLELLRDRERAAAFGRQALEGVTKRLGPGAIADEAIAFYQRVLARASAR